MGEVAIMARVSSDEQAKGYSLDVQKEGLENYCAKNGLTVGHIIREDHSAKSFNRPAFKEFLQLIKKDKKRFSKLLFTTWDRFSRNTAEAYAMITMLKDKGIECVAIEQPLDLTIPENKLILSVYITLPEIDNDRRSIKVKGGMRGALKAGRWNRKAPIGYKNSRDENNKPIIVPNEDSKVIMKAFKMISEGYTLSETLRAINKKSRKVSKSNLPLILRNPVYAGKIVVPEFENEPEEIIEGVHKGLVSEKLFDKVQLILTKKVKKVHNNFKEWEELPLRGLIECSKCGRQLTGSGSRSRNGDRYFYYHCDKGCNERHSATIVNKNLEKLISLIHFPIEMVDLLQRVIKEKIEEQRGTKILDKKQLTERYNTLLQQEDNLDELFLSQKIDSEKYNKLSERVKNEKLEIKDQLNSFEHDNTSLDSLIKGALRTLQNYSNIYRLAGIKEKRKMLGSMFPEKIQISGGKARTGRLNSVIQLILLKNNELQEQKKGQIDEFINLTSLVGPPGLEPGTP